MAWLRNTVGFFGNLVIQSLIFVFGRKYRKQDIPWLDGPMGKDYIGDSPYADCAKDEGLTLIRDAQQGGLINDFARLQAHTFDINSVSPVVRDFYENTAEFRMDVWAKTHFPLNIGMWLLVVTLSRKFNQLNFPTGALQTAEGMESEIVLLKDGDGTVRYNGWFRKLKASGLVIYTGFYMCEDSPTEHIPCVKVVFPMPGANATVLLRPSIDDEGNFHLISSGKRFGDAGFYRINELDADHVRVWRIKSLKEYFKLYTDDEGFLRCDHRVRFWGLPVLTLHYRIERKRQNEQVAAA